MCLVNSKVLLSVLFCVLGFDGNVRLTHCQECLSSPSSIGHDDLATDLVDSWTLTSDGFYSTTLSFDAVYVNGDDFGLPCSFTTRLINGDFPSPTLYMRPGYSYEIIFSNNLGNESDYNPSDGFKDPNTTNLHTHGLHTSPQSPGDSIFTTAYPGTSVTYEYYVPCNHVSGTHWYHPHHHGSTTLHVAGGAAGGLIIEQPSDEMYEAMEGMPPWLYEMDEIILLVQYWDLEYISSLYEDVGTDGSDIDFLTSYDEDDCSETSFFTLNGEYHPTICLEAGVWKRFRVINCHHDEPINMYFDDGDDCELELIARDGIVIDPAPRNVSHIWLAPGNRGDVAVRCHTEGNFGLYHSDTDLLGYIEVSGVVSDLVDLEKYNPTRPSYLEDLMDYSGDYNEMTIEVSADAVNDIHFESSDWSYLTSISINSVNEWTVETDIHPMHLHVYPFQVISGGFGDDARSDVAEGWHEEGDYLDTLLGDAIIRFKANLFGGAMTIHCHKFEHEDEGAMAVFHVDGGCDAELQNYDETALYTECEYDDVEAYCEAMASLASSTSTSTSTSTTTSSPTTTSSSIATTSSASTTTTSSASSTAVLLDSLTTTNIDTIGTTGTTGTTGTSSSVSAMATTNSTTSSSTRANISTSAASSVSSTMMENVYDVNGTYDTLFDETEESNADEDDAITIAMSAARIDSYCLLFVSFYLLQLFVF